MKIAYVTPSYHPAYIYGGPTYSALGLSTALAKARCDVRVLTTDANGREQTVDVDTAGEIAIEERLRVRYCHRVAVDSVSPTFLAELPALIAWADVVHLTAVYNFTTLPTLAAAKSARKPLVWTPRGALLRWQGTRRRTTKQAWEVLCRMLVPSRAVLHATSQREADQSVARFPRLPAAVIPNGVDLPPLWPKARAEHLRLLFLGRIDPIKGLENLFAACARLRADATSGWTLVIAGEGERGYVDSLKQSAEALGISARITFAGGASGAAKEALFDAADVFVTPSHSENFGNVVTEALAHAVPVIASQGTPWSSLEERGCGLWVPNDPGSLADAITRIDKLDLVEMGRRGRQWMESDFSWAHVARQMIRVYESLKR